MAHEWSKHQVMPMFLLSLDQSICMFYYSPELFHVKFLVKQKRGILCENPKSALVAAIRLYPDKPTAPHAMRPTCARGGAPTPEYHPSKRATPSRGQRSASTLGGGSWPKSRATAGVWRCRLASATTPTRWRALRGCAGTIMRHLRGVERDLVGPDPQAHGTALALSPWRN